MGISKKYIPLLAVVGILAFGLPLGTICSTYCTAAHLDLGSTGSAGCPVTGHFFVQAPVSWSSLFLMPTSDLSLAGDVRSMSPGFYWPPFKPPRIPV